MDKVNMTKNKNRRVSFRIYDEVNLFYKKIDEKLVAEPNPAFDNILNDSLDIDRVSQNSVLLSPGLKKKLPDVTVQGLQFKEHGSRNVNISASGMAFNCDDALKEGDYLAIKILLLSSMAVIAACCQVVYCKDSNQNDSRHPYLVGARFINMKNADRELLAKHMAKHKLQQSMGRGLVLAAAITILAAPGEVFGLLFELLHFLFEHFLELCHLTFEFIESTLDHLVEHLFHTDVHATQIIVFYVLVSFVIYGLYGLWRTLPPFCRRCKDNLFSAWARRKASLIYYWEEQPLFNKIKLAVIGIAAIILYISFGM
jgi:hypothetical protein